MSRYEDYVRKVEAEAEESGPQAVAELEAFREYYRIARQICHLRRERGLNQTQLAERAGICQSEISRIEQARGNPTLVTLTRVTSALGVPLCELLSCDASDDAVKPAPPT